MSLLPRAVKVHVATKPVRLNRSFDGASVGAASPACRPREAEGCHRGKRTEDALQLARELEEVLGDL